MCVSEALWTNVRSLEQTPGYTGLNADWADNVQDRRVVVLILMITGLASNRPLNDFNEETPVAWWIQHQDKWLCSALQNHKFGEIIWNLGCTVKYSFKQFRFYLTNTLLCCLCIFRPRFCNFLVFHLSFYRFSLIAFMLFEYCSFLKWLYRLFWCLKDS